MQKNPSVTQPVPPQQPLPDKLTNPMLILHSELKDKSLKKSALESLTTISLALGRKKTRNQLIPYLASIFTEQLLDNQRIIIKSLGDLIHAVYIGKPHHSKVILQLIMDILCVYPNKQIRQQAYLVLQKVLAYIDIRKAQNMIVDGIKKLASDQDLAEDANVRDLVLRMVAYVYVGVDCQKQKQLIEILNTYKVKLTDQKLLSQMLTQFIKVMPPAPEAEIRSIISVLIETGDKQILSNLIKSVALMAKFSGEESTVEYLNKIFQQADPSVFITGLKQYMSLRQIFSQEALAPLNSILSSYDNQPQQIKNVILELLDVLPLSQQSIQKLSEPPSSLQLKTTLSETLCRVHDTKALLKLFSSSDPNFQSRLFIKLPAVNQMHVEIIEKVLNSKSWRQKLGILANIQQRTVNGEDTTQLLTGLCKFLGDKIGCVRVAVGQAIKNIIITHKKSIQSLIPTFQSLVVSKNWFERQSAYRILLDLAKHSASIMQKQQKQEILKLCDTGLADKVVNIRQIVQQLKEILTKQ